MSDADAEAARQRDLAALADSYGLNDPETPDLVRWVLPEEIGPVRSVCLAEYGFNVESAHGGSGLTGYVPPDQQDAYNLADYACTAMYPVDPRVVQPITPERLSLIYDYWAEFVVPCLEEHGVTPNPPLPSRQTVIDAGGLWDGYPRGNAAIDEACPQNPPSRALLGENY